MHHALPPPTHDRDCAVEHLASSCPHHASTAIPGSRPFPINGSAAVGLACAAPINTAVPAACSRASQTQARVGRPTQPLGGCFRACHPQQHETGHVLGRAEHQQRTTAPDRDAHASHSCGALARGGSLLAEHAPRSARYINQFIPCGSQVPHTPVVATSAERNMPCLIAGSAFCAVCLKGASAAAQDCLFTCVECARLEAGLSKGSLSTNSYCSPSCFLQHFSGAHRGSSKRWVAWRGFGRGGAGRLAAGRRHKQAQHTGHALMWVCPRSRRALVAPRSRAHRPSSAGDSSGSSDPGSPASAVVPGLPAGHQYSMSPLPHAQQQQQQQHGHHTAAPHYPSPAHRRGSGSDGRHTYNQQQPQRSSSGRRV
jgi:hypothetical protein